MKVLIDGKTVECLNDVKVIYEDQDVGNDTERVGELHIQLSEEGMTVDTYFNDDPYKSMWQSLDDIIEECI